VDIRASSASRNASNSASWTQARRQAMSANFDASSNTPHSPCKVLMTDNNANQRRSLNSSDASAPNSRSRMPSPTGLTQTKHAVFEQFDPREYASLGRLGAPQTLARAIEGGGIGLGVCPESAIFGACDDAGFVRGAPFAFQAVYSAVEFEIETAHG
jgi:hypothetical protein